MDHGLAFLHGHRQDFLDALQAVPGRWLDNWPAVVRGTGTPCQPSAYVHGSRRMAHANGVSAFPKHLAVGLDVALETNVTGLELVDDGIRVLATQRDKSVSFVGRNIVLALAGPQALALLGDQLPLPQCETARAVLRMMPSVPSATVIALYHPEDAEILPWDIWYPEASTGLLLIAHDSAKRDTFSQLALVLQARPAWSKAALATNADKWAPRLLDDAVSLLGPWVARPNAWQAHLWQHARTSPECELAGPLLLDLGRGRRLGLAGELFAPGGGVQAAWQSGRQLALRLLEEVQQ